MDASASEERTDGATYNANTILWATAYQRAAHCTTPGASRRRGRVTDGIGNSMSVGHVGTNCCCDSEWSGDPTKIASKNRGVCNIQQTFVTEMKRVLTKKVVVSRPS
jgi:hypothetical protein